MEVKAKQNRAAVKREKAEQYILLSLISFASTIMLTRLFLELTGYPQIGNSELHIAHVLWGGLFLFAAVILPVIYSNKWAVSWSAILGGMGFGLFLDEIGKFITQSNDYFYPPAAPIVYVVFLFTVFLYQRVRKSSKITARDELYRVFQSLTELLDNDLDRLEKNELETRLSMIIANTDDQNIRELSSSLLHFIQSENISIVPQRKSKIGLFITGLARIIEKVFTRNRLRWILIIGLGWIGATSVLDLTTLTRVSINIFSQSELPMFLTKGETLFALSPIWFTVRLAVQGMIGFVSLLAAISYLVRKETLATNLGIIGLTLALTVVNILVFYLDQFSASIEAVFELVLFLAILAYRRRFLVIEPAL